VRGWQRCAAGVLALIVGAGPMGCSRGGGGGDGDVGATERTARMCQLLDLPRETLDEEDLTVEDALDVPGKEGVGIRALFALLGADDVSPTRFRPALRYLARRWESDKRAEAGGPQPIAPSDAVVGSARELDEFLAGGGCG